VPAGKSDSASFFFSEVVDGECNPVLCRTLEEDGQFLVKLNPSNSLIAFVSSRENLMRLDDTRDPNLNSEKRSSLFVDLPAAQKQQPQAVNNSQLFTETVGTQNSIVDVAFRPRYNQVLVLSPRLVSLWSTQGGAFRYAHTLAIDANLGGFSPQGDTLYLAGKIEAPNEEGKATTKYCVGFFRILDVDPKANAPKALTGTMHNVRYRVIGPEGSEGLGIAGGFTGAGENDVPIPDDVTLPWETTVSMPHDAIFLRHTPLQLNARAVPQPVVPLTVEIYVDDKKISDANGFAPKLTVQKH
jgi:hypothetical protein